MTDLAPDTIPFVDLTRQYASIKSEIDAAIQQTLDRGTFAAGAAVARFENEFAEYVGARYACAVSKNRTPASHAAATIWMAASASGCPLTLAMP